MKSGFQLRVPRHLSRIYLSLTVSIAVSLFFFLVLLQRVLAFHGSLLQVTAMLFFGAFFILSLYLNFYLYRLIETKKSSALIFGEKEWKDSISILFLGLHPLREIKSTRIRDWSGIEFLNIEISETVFETVHPKWFRNLYLKVFGHHIYIPLFILDITRLDLESQFVHLESLIEGAANFKNDFDKIVEEKKVGSPVKKVSDSKNIFSQISNSASKPIKEEQRHPVLQEVDRRREEFREKGLDTLVCELFYDYLRFLPKWTERQSSRIPEGLELLQHRQEDHDYEEIGFRWQNRDLQMGLRTNLGESTEALLSLAVDGDVKVNLRVGVEIGTLDPRALERYITGDWETLLTSLGQAFRDPAKGESDPEEKQADDEKTQKIDDLKKNFGLKD